LELLAGWPDSDERARYELLLQATLGPALIVSQGWASQEAERAFVRARELMQQLGDVPQRQQVLFGLAALHEWRAEYQQSQALIEQCVDAPSEGDGSDYLAESCDLLACSLFHQGAFAAALQRAEQGLALYQPERQYALIAAFGEDPGVQNHGWAAFSLWFLGYPDRALERAHTALRLAQTHVYSLALAQGQTAWIHQFRREPRLTREWAEASLALATTQGFPYLRANGMVLRGWALAASGEHAAGIAQLQEGLVCCRETGAMIDHPYFLALLAESYSYAGESTPGLAAVDEALTLVRNSRTFFFEAELHRLRGTLLLQTNDASMQEAAEASYMEALALARRQGARSLELRAAIDLGRLWRMRGRSTEAHQLVRETSAGFTEGHDSGDLQAASELIRASA
jgi:adenylate cyclase